MFKYMKFYEVYESPNFCWKDCVSCAVELNSWVWQQKRFENNVTSFLHVYNNILFVNFLLPLKK